MARATAERRFFSAGAALPAAVVLLGLVAIVYSTWPIWRALFPLEIDLDEPWNAYWADAVLAGRTLYPHPGALIANNYPPLSFYVVAGLSSFGWDAVAIGRALSLVAIAATGLAIAACVRELGGTRLAAAVAGLWFVATTAHFFIGYAGKNDPTLPALVLMVAALAWLLRRQRRGRAAEPAILLMVVAGFYKHNLVATPVTALLWIMFQDRRRGLRALAVAGTCVALGLVLCVALHGTDFLRQLFFPREHSLRWALGNLGQLQWIVPALLIWAIWFWHDRDNDAARFTFRYVTAAFVAYFLQKLGMGIGVNAQFELAAATAIGLGMAFSRTSATSFARRWGADASRLLIVGILLARLLLSNHIEPYLVLASPEYRRLFSENARVAAQEIERVRNIPGPVHCSLMTVCRQAGKPFVFDPFAVEQKLRTGKLTQGELAAAIAAQGIRFESIDARAGTDWANRRLLLQMR